MLLENLSVSTNSDFILFLLCSLSFRYEGEFAIKYERFLTLLPIEDDVAISTSDKAEVEWCLFSAATKEGFNRPWLTDAASFLTLLLNYIYAELIYIS